MIGILLAAMRPKRGDRPARADLHAYVLERIGEAGETGVTTAEIRRGADAAFGDGPFGIFASDVCETQKTTGLITVNNGSLLDSTSRPT